MNVNDSSPVFSVIIPAYNREKTIRRTIESVLRQTFQMFEIIVVDDGSADSTKSVVESIQDDRLRYIYQDNQGAQVARNRGIIEADGEWIAFLDSDDEWVPEKLERQFAVLKEENFNPYIVVHGNCLVKDIINNKEEVWDLTQTAGYDIYAKILCSHGALFPNIVTSKKALETIGFLDINVPAFQEWDTSIALAKYCKFVAISEPLFVYYLHPGDTISKNQKRDIDGYYYIIKKWKSEILSHCGEKGWKRHLYFLCERCVSFGFFDRMNEIYYETCEKQFQLSDFIDEIRERIRSVRNFYCYGAGETGSLAKHFFDALDMHMTCFVVSPGEPTGLHEGILVQSIDCIDSQTPSLVIISTRENLHNPIKDILHSLNFDNVYPVSDEVHFMMIAFLKLNKNKT